MKSRWWNWFIFGGLLVLAAGGCSSDSNTGASYDTFPYGLSTAALTYDGNQDGVDEDVSNGRFSYDGQGRVTGYEATYQSDYDSDGIVDYGTRVSYTFDPTIPFDQESELPISVRSLSAKAVPAGTVVAAKGRFFLDDYLLYMISSLGHAAPVAMVAESYSSGVGIFSSGLPEQLVLDYRSSLTLSYDAAGRPVRIVVREEDRDGIHQYTMSRSLNDAGDPLEEVDLEEYFAPGVTPAAASGVVPSVSIPYGSNLSRTIYSYDSAGNLTKRVEIGDDNNDGFYEYQEIFNFANSYNEAGQLVEVLQTRPGSTWRMTTTREYDAAGNLTSELSESQDVAEGPVVERYRYDYTYDAAGNQLTKTYLVDYNPADGTWDYTWEYSWAYDGVGEMLSEEYRYDNNYDGTWDGGNGRRWNYDATGRLTEIQELSGVPLALNQKRSYRYDAAGRVEEAGTYQPGYGTDTTLFSFDTDGNILSIADTFTPEVAPAIVLPPGYSNLTTFSYDAAGQITGYINTEDQNGDGINEYKEEVVVTSNEPTLMAVAKSYYYDTGTSAYVQQWERTLDLGFLTALPKGDMVLPAFFQDNVNQTLPKVPGLLLYGRELLQGPTR